jgi:hypothetical protein
MVEWTTVLTTFVATIPASVLALGSVGVLIYVGKRINSIEARVNGKLDQVLTMGKVAAVAASDAANKAEQAAEQSRRRNGQ